MIETIDRRLSTGIPSLDQILKGVNAGDNIVWRVETVEDYADLVLPFADCAVRNGHHLIYFRFANHPPLLDASSSAKIFEFDPGDGFEPLLDRIHEIIRGSGRGAFYVLDSLSDFQADWKSDQMLANFFMLTCPYLFDLETVTYFALYHGHHSPELLDPILETTQLFLDVYRHRGSRYIRPVKVQHRYSSTMNMLHAWSGRDVQLVTSSATISEVLNASAWHRSPHLRSLNSAMATDNDSSRAAGVGSFAPAQEEGAQGLISAIRSEISRDPKIQPLLARWLTPTDLQKIQSRKIGTGLIGGKAVGMLLARAMLQGVQPRFADLLEEHDSFFVGSDVYCTYLVRNGVWWLRQRQHNTETLQEGAEQARRRILTGTFPDRIMRQFEDMLDYFGSAPFIVRSSSLLEDGFGYTFAGKYDSIFCANQGPRERRLADFLAAVRTVYASAMGERALWYRAERGLLAQDEQMALLIMRVSGELHGRMFFPPAAGVGFSYNPYVWYPDIDPHAGVIRLVFGLGTRAVNQSDDDYTRLVALNAPLRRPEVNFDEVCERAQRKMDYIDLEANRLVSSHFLDVIDHAPGLPLELFLSMAKPDGSGGPTVRAMTFDGLLKHTPFVEDMRAMLNLLQTQYGRTVDIEFTVNFPDENHYKINLVQCRPLQVRGVQSAELPQVSPRSEDVIIDARGAVLGYSRVLKLDRFIYVVPDRYARLSIQDRYEVARLLGRLNRVASRERPGRIMLLGPGRWGTSSPELGIPVTFSDINRSSVICEIVCMHEGLIPDVSLGTHFLNEFVEMDMLYLALFPHRGNNRLEESFFVSHPSRLLELAPDALQWQETVRVLDVRDAIQPGERVILIADAMEQRVLCVHDRTAEITLADLG
ncbi:MAG: hypothetical protein JW829_18685 [Pirellulales bacterium]|nr:hypothetical protein [Pirellulales bacterium]